MELVQGGRLTRKPNSAMVSDRFTKMDVTPNIVFLQRGRALSVTL